MKKYVKLLLCLLFVSIDVLPAREHKQQSTRKWRRSKNKKRKLAQYFNVDTQADVVSSKVEEKSNISPESKAEEYTSALSTVDNKDAVISNQQGHTIAADSTGEESEDNKLLLPYKPSIHQAQGASTLDSIDGVEDTGINIPRKKESTVQLVHKAVAFLNNNTIEDSFSAFLHSKEFVKGDLCIFVYRKDGVCVVDPHNPENMWKNVYDMKDTNGVYPVRDLINAAEKGEGWLSSIWNGVTELSYVTKVTKGDKVFYIASGFYTHSTHDFVVHLVKSAVARFKEKKKSGRPVADAFADYSYPAGNFVQGDLYVYAMRYDGLLVAHGIDSEYIGTHNGLKYQDEAGRYINKEIIEKLEAAQGGIWLDYLSKNTLKKLYAEKIEDNKGNRYFVACGYYPDADRDRAVDLVRKAYSYIKTNGITVASLEATNNNEFRYGDLYIEIYDMQGKCLANGLNKYVVGTNRIDAQNEDGRYFVRDIIEKGKKGGGWVNYKLKRLFRSVYVESVNMGLDTYVIACGVYPISKKETMMLLVKGAVGRLESSELSSALRDFVKAKSKYRRGDLEVFVIEDTGICLAYGNEYDLIWRNLFKLPNSEVSQVFQKMIKAAKSGSATMQYELKGEEKVSYIESVQKDGKNYIVGSGYYV